MKPNLAAACLPGLLFLAGFLPTTVLAQEQKVKALCTAGTAQAVVESGNIKTRLLNGGDMFWNFADPQFEVPKNSGKHSIFGGAVWFGGIETGGLNNLHLAAQTYRQGNPADIGFWPGPLDQTASISDAQCSQYDRIWHFTRQQINHHIAHYADSGYVVPQNIATWPAAGNALHGNGSHVPFVDANNNGTYEPLSGDYPDLPGDNMAYTIMNDAGGVKVPTSPTIGLELHTLMYGFNEPNNPAINNTLFARYTFINRGSKTFADTYFGKWVDFDLGYYNDDYVGCDSTRSLFYGYNADNFDEGPDGYGANPPAQGVVFLNVPLTNFTYFENNSSPINGNPEQDNDYYHYMKSRWGNGNPIYYGGNGTVGTVGSTTTKFMFSGDPVTGTGWSEVTENNPPGDRRGIGAHGPFTFAPGDVKVFELAYPWVQGSSNLQSIADLRVATQQIKSFYNSVLGTGEQTTAPQLAVQLYPNPTTGSITVQCTGTATHTAFTLRDLTGRTVLQTAAQLPAGPAQHQLNLERVPQGMYLLQVQRGQVSQTVRVVKQ